MRTGHRAAAMRRSLEGLALGDSLGRALRVAPTNDPSFDDPPWAYTDDTEMAIAIAQLLASRGRIMQDELALRFATRFAANPDRGYGGVAFWILSRISAGHDWRSVATEPYGGSGSLGNGAAMRVGPLGAYFADDFPRARERSGSVCRDNPCASRRPGRRGRSGARSSHRCHAPKRRSDGTSRHSRQAGPGPGP